MQAEGAGSAGGDHWGIGREADTWPDLNHGWYASLCAWQRTACTNTVAGWPPISIVTHHHLPPNVLGLCMQQCQCSAGITAPTHGPAEKAIESCIACDHGIMRARATPCTRPSYPYANAGHMCASCCRLLTDDWAERLLMIYSSTTKNEIIIIERNIAAKIEF